MLQDVDSKLTFSLIESIVPRHSGIKTVPLSGLNMFLMCSMNSLMNCVSAATPSAGLQPNRKVKLAA